MEAILIQTIAEGKEDKMELKSCSETTKAVG